MAMFVLQANINHSARAQDLLLQSLAEWSIHIAVVAEPYLVPARDNWVGDNDSTVAIVTQTGAGSSPFEKVAKGKGCVAAYFKNMTVVAAYFSPNRSLAEFEQFIFEVEALVAQSRFNPVLVAGDFNAKSMAWGSRATDARGEVLEEWAAMSGLILLNRGSVNTCSRWNGGSIVDVTFASPTLANRIRDWKVLEEVETLSDHRYIRFEVSAPLTRTQSNTCLRNGAPRWALKSLDGEMIAEAATVQSWLPALNDTLLPTDINGRAEWLVTTMTQVCDAGMRRVGSRQLRRWVYWWSAKLQKLREACVAARRQYTHYRRRRHRVLVEENHLYALYRECVTALQAAITDAKSAAWEEWLYSLNRDPWGRPYRSVRAKLRSRSPPLTQTFHPVFLAQVNAALFPDKRAFTPPSMTRVVESSVAQVSTVPEVSKEEFAAAVHRLRAKNTAPGPDGIPSRAWVLAMTEMEPRVIELFTECLKQGCIPRRWKTGKLVLLRKEGRPLNSPSAYRPIVLLDEVSKLFERIISVRLIKHLEQEGPSLSNNQFGFRQGRSTIDAIAKLRNLSEEAVSRGEVVLAVSLDIANAFNTLPWECIKEALAYHGVPRYLRLVLDSYLSERAVIFPMIERWGRREMSCGVPQGSVLGPLLWNIGYDWVLRGANPRGVDVLCYADDTLVTSRGTSFRDAALLATAGVAQVVARIRRLGLEVALNKTEALCFHGARRAPPVEAQLIVGGINITVKSTMRYLGIVLDSRWSFIEHFRHLAPRLVCAAGALSQLLPNLDGPNATCRLLYTGVVRSMALYGAPIWSDALTSRTKPFLRRAQRVMAVRVVRGYRTISFEAACVLAGTPPWDLEAEVLGKAYWRRATARAVGRSLNTEEIARSKKDDHEGLLRFWGLTLEEPSAGHRTIGAIRPILEKWVNRGHGRLTFHLVQILSGHGCFGRYLHKVACREPTSVCYYCGCPEDTAQHTLEECPEWAEPRADLVAKIGNDLSLLSVAKAIVGSDGSWNALSSFCEKVMSQKEAAERMREMEISAYPNRRKRVGRRRLAYERRLPP